MKKTSLKQVISCDICGKEEDYMRSCMECGKDICYECSKNHAVSYNHAVNFSGTNDGFYCLDCDSKLKESGDRPLFNAYLMIQKLRQEQSLWYADFNKRQKEVEELIENLNR